MMTADQETTNLGLQLPSMFIYNVIKNKTSLKKKKKTCTPPKTKLIFSSKLF